MKLSTAWLLALVVGWPPTALRAEEKAPGQLPTEELNAAKAAFKARGWIYYANGRTGHLFVARSDAVDADLKNLPHPKFPFELDLGATGVTDAGLAHLREFKHLAGLHLSATKVSDAGLTAR